MEECNGSVCHRLHATLGVNIDGNPNWMSIFYFPKWVLNNIQLSIILFQTWLSPFNDGGGEISCDAW